VILSIRSERNLQGVHPDLVAVVRRAAEIMPEGLEFIVTEGVRTTLRQVELMRAGATRTMRSRHIKESNKCGLGCAVDLAAMIGGEVRWDWPLYNRLAEVVKQAAADVRVRVEWGGDWATFKDGPHYQLPWDTHP
jgi:peptidoglycan LD-endopeptidase CwlK